ncbi:MAG: hypothetical protein ACKO37_06725 [Vampirovibrionales bacterium]
MTYTYFTWHKRLITLWKTLIALITLVSVGSLFYQDTLYAETVQVGLQETYTWSYTLAHLIQRLDRWQLPSLHEATETFTRLTQFKNTKPTLYAKVQVCLAKEQLETSWQLQALVQPVAGTSLGGISAQAPQALSIPFASCDSIQDNFQHHIATASQTITYAQRHAILVFLHKQVNHHAEGFQEKPPQLHSTQTLSLQRLPRDNPWHWVGLYLQTKQALLQTTLTEDERLQWQLTQARSIQKLHQGFQFPISLLTALSN